MAYIHSLEDLLQEANTRIETLETNLLSATRRLDAQAHQINSMSDIMSSTSATNLLMPDYTPSCIDVSLMFGD